MTIVGVILAGGASRRMGGSDKARAILNGRSPIDQVCERFAGPVDHLAIAGANDDETGRSVVADDLLWSAGPVRGAMYEANWAND